MMFLLGGCKWICMNDKFNHKFSDWWISFRSCSMLHDLGYVHTFLLLSWSFFSMLFYMLCMVNKYIVGRKNQTHSFWNKIANITYGHDLNLIVFVVIVSLMNSINVFLQIPCLRKWFTARFTVVVLLALMNCLNVSLYMSCLWKGFATSITFKIFLTFVDCVNVIL